MVFSYKVNPLLLTSINQAPRIIVWFVYSPVTDLFKVSKIVTKYSIFNDDPLGDQRDEFKWCEVKRDS